MEGVIFVINWFRFLKLTLQDIKNKDKDKFIGGFYIYVNEMGAGKTLSMVREAKMLHDKGYKVYSNFCLSFQEYNLMHWRDIPKVPPNSVILLDEISDLFNSREWKNMPKGIFTYLINSRKRNVRIMSTAQEYDEIDKTIRTKATYVIECSHLGRLIRNKFYKRKIYEMGYGNKGRKSEFSEWFIREDFYSDYYDTNEVVKVLEGMENSN
jgi:hypothetical protein